MFNNDNILQVYSFKLKHRVYFSEIAMQKPW